jgi:hypothetical protein
VIGDGSNSSFWNDIWYEEHFLNIILGICSIACLKVALFAWLIGLDKILTLDNLKNK